jgi:hypothetical protein
MYHGWLYMGDDDLIQWCIYESYVDQVIWLRNLVSIYLFMNDGYQA